MAGCGRYHGINDVFAVPCEGSATGSLKFEVQFHTPVSFAHKSKEHAMYSEFRSTLDPDRKVSGTIR